MGLSGVISLQQFHARSGAREQAEIRASAFERGAEGMAGADVRIAFHGWITGTFLSGA
jgi:hypothetical protein